jgi:hypothetical protein
VEFLRLALHAVGAGPHARYLKRAKALDSLNTRGSPRSVSLEITFDGSAQPAVRRAAVKFVSCKPRKGAERVSPRRGIMLQDRGVSRLTASAPAPGTTEPALLAANSSSCLAEVEAGRAQSLYRRPLRRPAPYRRRAFCSGAGADRPDRSRAPPTATASGRDRAARCPQQSRARAGPGGVLVASTSRRQVLRFQKRSGGRVWRLELGRTAQT